MKNFIETILERLAQLAQPHQHEPIPLRVISDKAKRGSLDPGYGRSQYSRFASRYEQLSK